VAAPAHLLLPALTDTALSDTALSDTALTDTALSKPSGESATGPGPIPPSSPVRVFSAEGTCAEAPLTSEPPLPDAEPLTSEPPLAEAAPLTSESAAEPADQDPCGPER
jgi:hypothetical protein